MGKRLDASAVVITAGVGTMYCAILFSILPLFALPDAINQTMTTGSPVILVNWFSSNFAQLVLLPVILVAQNIAARKADAAFAASEQRAQETHDAVMEELADIRAMTNSDRKLTPKEAADLIHAVCVRTPTIPEEQP